MRAFKIKWRYMIHTRRGWKVQMREKRLFIDWDRYSQNRM